jgi:hypothetical protein
VELKKDRMGQGIWEWEREKDRDIVRKSEFRCMLWLVCMLLR